MDVGLWRDGLTVLLGFVTGLLSGLFGVGGGVISQPGMRLLGLEPLLVIGTALPAVIPGSISGSLRYRKERLVLWPAVAATVPLGMLAAVGGSLLSEEVPGNGHLLQLATACLLGLSAYRMGRIPVPLPPEEPRAESDALDAPVRPRVPSTAVPAVRFALIGLLAGSLSGLLGIGGGVIMVPAFIALARVEVKSAIATSLVCVGLFAIPGTITHLIEGHVDVRVAVALIIGTIPGARVGASLTIRATERRIRITVATFLGVVAVFYGGSELAALVI
jgi:uncharacterized membrane protein YfcA